MNISPITTFKNNKIQNIQKKQSQTPKNINSVVTSNPINENKIIPFYKPAFRGNNFAKLYEEYNWYIRNDHTPAINSFLKINQPKEIINEFFKEILLTADRGYEIIESIVNQPRNTIDLAKQLNTVLGEDSRILRTFLQDSPYRIAYENFIKRKFENSSSVIELLKIRPDWRGDKLLEKHAQSGNSNFTIGCVPKQISKDHMYRIVDFLKDKMEYGVKYDKKIENLILDGRTYEFKYFTEGKSSKNVFGLFVPSVCKKYVVKMEPAKSRSLDAPFALGTLAKIDAYLTCNRSRNSAPLCYYDHENNFSIYKYIEHANIKDNTKDITLIKSKLPDFKALGLDYNDTVGYKNFFILNEKSLDTHYRMEGFNEAIPRGEWISVDNDHVTYSNPLNPKLNEYHCQLPNAMQMFF